MDKYLVVVLVFLIGGMGISVTRDPPQYFMFYAMMGGAIVVILYNSFKIRRKAQAERRKRWRSKK